MPEIHLEWGVIALGLGAAAQWLDRFACAANNDHNTAPTHSCEVMSQVRISAIANPTQGGTLNQAADASAEPSRPRRRRQATELTGLVTIVMSSRCSNGRPCGPFPRITNVRLADDRGTAGAGLFPDGLQNGRLGRRGPPDAAEVE
jgi:hypothetical protein